MTKIPVFRLVQAYEFDCPFCGGTFGVLQEENAIYHNTPACAAYRDSDVIAFLHAVNVVFGHHDAARLN